MIRPHFDIRTASGYLLNIYAPLQWNEVASVRKMVSDCREWLHNHHPEWCRARIYLTHKSHTDVLLIERGQIL